VILYNRMSGHFSSTEDKMTSKKVLKRNLGFEIDPNPSCNAKEVFYLDNAVRIFREGYYDKATGSTQIVKVDAAKIFFEKMEGWLAHAVDPSKHAGDKEHKYLGDLYCKLGKPELRVVTAIQAELNSLLKTMRLAEYHTKPESKAYNLKFSALARPSAMSQRFIDCCEALKNLLNKGLSSVPDVIVEEVNKVVGRRFSH